MSSFFFRAVNACVVAFVCTWFSACGGGGGSSVPPPKASATLTVASSTVSITATTADAAPTSQLKATVSNPGSSQYYFSKTFTTNGLSAVDVTSDGSVATYNLQLKTPSSLAPGSYSDTLTIEACVDSGCSQQIQGSPINVTISYVVSNPPGNTAVLTSLGPNAVTAGGTDFRLVVSGSRFDATSVVQWNGTMRPTSMLSPTLLMASINASDIAANGNAQVTVANLETTGTTVSNSLTFSIASNVPPKLILPTQTISASYDTSLGGGAILNHPIVLTVNGPTNATYFYSVSFTGSAVGGMSIDGQTGAISANIPPSGPAANRITGEPGGLGQIITGTFVGSINSIEQLYFVSGAELGAGTYSDTISVKVCTDAACTQPVADSPQSIAVTYTVTGNPIPFTQFSTPGGFIVLEAQSAGAAPAGSMTISSNGLPPYGAYVYPTVGSGGALAGATVQSDLDGTATLTIMGKPPATLGSGIYADSVQLKICFDSECAKLATTVSLNVRYIVDATPGVDFTQTTITGTFADIAWNPTRARIYATANSDTGGISQSLLVIDPATASIEQVVSLGQGSDPTSIALSDDGNYAYIIDSVSNQVLQVDLGTLTISRRVQISTEAERLQAVPGEPTSFAVQSYNNYTTLLIYDGATPRPQGFSTGSLETNLLYTFGADASTVYAYDVALPSSTMYQLAVTNNGFAVTRQTADVVINLGNNDELVYAGGLVYSLTGSIFDPSTQSVKTPFSMLNTSAYGGNSQSYAFAVDASLNRAFFMTDDSSFGTVGQMTLEGFNLTTQAPTWLARFPSSNPLGGRMIRWGTNGIAFVGGNVAAPNITLISGSVVSR